MPASVRLAAVSAVAASLFATTLPARSADLYAPPPYGSAYDEPRYGDSYDEDAPAYERYAEPQDNLEPRYVPPRYAAQGGDCVPRRIAHARLRADGWRDFRDFLARGNVVLMQARRPSGRLFDLTIDTCSGEIIAARPLDEGRVIAAGQRRYLQPY